MQQGFLNCGGCLHFILLHRAVEGFQQSSSFLGNIILKDHYCIENEQYVGKGLTRQEQSLEMVQGRVVNELD